jgi:hypothetical protein
MREFDALTKRRTLDIRKQDARSAQLCALTAEIHRDPAKRSTPFTADEFMQSAEPKEMPQQTPEEMLTMAKMFTIRSGGVIPEG